MVVLIVERQVANLDLVERALWRRKFCDRQRELAVERITAKAADHDSDGLLAHMDLLNK